MATQDDTRDPNAQIFDTAKGGLYGGPFDISSLDPNVRALLMDYRWTTSFDGSVPATTMTYAFPTSTSDYSKVPGYPWSAALSTFAPLTDSQKAAVIVGVDLVASYTQLTFTLAASASAADATLRFGNWNPPGGHSEARFPPNHGPYAASDSREAGDIFLGTNGQAPANFFGTDDFNTIIHEMGACVRPQAWPRLLIQRRARFAIQRQRILGDDLCELSGRQHFRRHGSVGRLLAT